MKRLIIHFEDCPDIGKALRHIINVLPQYFKEYPDDGRRITVQFADKYETVMLYHNMKDLMIFSWHETQI